VRESREFEIGAGTGMQYQALVGDVSIQAELGDDAVVHRRPFLDVEPLNAEKSSSGTRLVLRGMSCFWVAIN
jgi:hypothetical protein